MSLISVFFQSLSPWFAKTEYTKSSMSDYYNLYFLINEFFSTVLDIRTCVCVYIRESVCIRKVCIVHMYKSIIII